MKTIPAKQAKVHFAYFVQRDQLGMIIEIQELSLDVTTMAKIKKR